MDLQSLIEVVIEQVRIGALTIAEMAGLDLGLTYKVTESNTPATNMGMLAAERIRAYTEQRCAELSLTFFAVSEEIKNFGDPAAKLVFYIDPDDGSSRMPIWQPGDLLPVTGSCAVLNGETVVAAYGDPSHNEIVLAIKGHGAWILPLDGSGTHNTFVTRKPAQPHAKSYMYVDALQNPETRIAFSHIIRELGRYCMNMRTEASCLTHLGRLMRGQCDLVLIHAMSGFWDIGIALGCQEVGCKVTDIHGYDIFGPAAPPRRDGSYPLLLATAPGLPHEEILKKAQEAYGFDYPGFRGKNEFI